MNTRIYCYLLLTALFFGAGCANIVAPTGGEKDIAPPKLVSVLPADSQKNVRTSKIRLNFDEYIVTTDAINQVIISPILPVPPTVTSLNKHVVISFPDSLLLPNTTYHVSFGTAIRDNHEGNIYKSSGYLFSTGSYFDSLSLSGRVINSATGLPDSAATIVLYPGTETDSAFLRKKPMYATHVNAGGEFVLPGLPGKTFNIYVLRDKNNNLAFDDPTEWIGFADKQVVPGMDSGKIVLRSFPVAGADTIKKDNKEVTRAGRNRLFEGNKDMSYVVLADTADRKRRSFDITDSLTIAFAQAPGKLQTERIFLTYDSAEVTVEVPFIPVYDSAGNQLKLAVKWAEDAIYTLRLQKGFAKDTSGNDLLPGRYSFHTRRDEDYAKLTINMPPKYQGDTFLLEVVNDVDTIYRKPVTKATVALIHLPPGNYKLKVIGDKNKNGQWDTGDLFAKKQPEEVFPYSQVIMLKAGWENQVDFEPEPEPVKKSPEKSPGKLPQ